MADIDDLIARSSIGKGLLWVAFGRSLRDARLRFRLNLDYVSRLSNLPRSRLLEIEAGAPPEATVAEIRAIASAVGVNADRLVSRMPR